MSGVRIAERGYRRYEGERRGPGAAVTTTARHTLRELLGLRRRAREKILPWGIAVASYLPAIGFVTVTLVAPAAFADITEDLLPGPEAYLGGILLLVYLATALAGPGALCPDRRSGMLALYLASPLRRDTYLASKAAAVVTYLALVTVVPPLIYVLGTVLAGGGPGDAMAVAAAVGRVVLAGTALALLFAALSLAAASLTQRRAAAAVGIILFVVLSAALIPVLANAYDAPATLRLLDVTAVANQTTSAIYGQRLAHPAWVVGLVWLTVTVALYAFATWRMRRLVVHR